MEAKARDVSKAVRLSKSRFVLGLQCEKALYLKTYEPHLAEVVSDSQQLIFDQGTEVGREAQRRYPDGVLIVAGHNDLERAKEQTARAVADGALHIFEATFEHDGVLVRVDILTRAGVTLPWQIVEVKSSTKVKPEHVQDVAVQLWVLRGAGLEVASATVLHVNNRCVFPNLGDLFTEVDVMKDAEDLLPSVPAALETFKATLAGAAAPNHDIGPHCDDPYSCSFKSHCWAGKNIPVISVFDIPRLATAAKWEHYANGATDLSLVNLEQLNPTQLRMVKHTLAGERFVDKSGVAEELATWEYPLSFLDFETIAHAVPRHPGVRPYNQVPFQFSCHIQARPDAPLEHVEWLHMEDSDPREDIARALAEKLPAEGSVVAYFMSFEKKVLQDLATQYPKYSSALTSLAERLVDPLPIFRAHVYDPKFAGSFSIKDVAPAILGERASYAGMMVGDGGQAQVAFLEATSAKTTPARKAQLKAALLDYCRKDTLGMVELVWWLQGFAQR